MRGAISCLMIMGVLSLDSEAYGEAAPSPTTPADPTTPTNPTTPIDAAPACADGFVLVDGVCKEYCSAKNVWTGRCDPNCARWVGDSCAACQDRYHLKEGICVRLLWVSGGETTIGDGDYTHSCLIVTPPTSWVAVPGANWIFDRDKERKGTYLVTEKYVFDPWVQARMKQVTLEVACEDSCKIFFNGNLIDEKNQYYSTTKSYDITSYVRVGATQDNPNSLEIHVSNGSAQGGTVYKLVTHQYCPKGAVDVEGVCVCRVGWIPLGEMCIQTAWISGTDTLIDHPNSKPATIVTKYSAWRDLANAPYIWDTEANKIGTFRFLHKVYLSEWLRPKFSNATLTVIGGDSFRILFNGKSVIENGSTKDKSEVTYDVTKYFDVAATEDKPNVLQIFVINSGVYGGLAYKLVVHQKCPPNSEDIEGVCKCKENFALVDDGCTQVAWISNTDTIVEGAVKEPSRIISSSTLKPISKTVPMIWFRDSYNAGTFLFTSPPIFLGAWLRSNVASVSLTINADLSYQFWLNDISIVDKASAPDKEPLTYDLTPYFRVYATADNPNILKIAATKMDGYGGLTYKLVVHMKCPVDAEDKSGVCECKSGFAKALGRCIKTAWYSDCPEAKWSTSYRATTYVPDVPTRLRAPGAAQVWDTRADRTLVHTNVYRHEIPLIDWIRTRIERATLQITSDDYYRVIFNGELITAQISATSLGPIHDLTNYLKFNPGMNAPSINDLRIEAYRGGGSTTVSYRLAIELKCATGAAEVNGVCRCKDGYAMIDGECVQFTWVSREQTQAGDGEMEHSCFVAAQEGQWRKVPGSTFIWDQRKDRYGTYRFSTLMPLNDWVRTRLDRVTLDLFVDNNFTIAFNGNIVDSKTAMLPEIASYDITKYMSKSANPDLLEIHATNSDANGVLSYKLVAHLKCPPNTVDMDGACVCLPGFGSVNDVCTQGAWTSGPDTFMGEDWAAYQAVSSLRYSVENWVWQYSSSNSGTNRLFHKIVVPNGIKSKVTGATLYVNVDNYAKVMFNGQVIAEKITYKSPPSSFDVGQYLKLDATEEHPNLLEFWATVTSSSSPGIYYKFVLRLNCGNNQVDVDGICQCKFGYTSIAGVCYQAGWVSDKTTKTGESAKETSVLVSAAGTNIPGANWIWYQDQNKIGTIRFSEQIILPSILRDKVTKVFVVVSVDEYFRLIFNGETIVDRATSLQTYDLTTKFKTGADESNLLEILATNTVNSGGLAYKFIVQTTCQDGAENIEGTCKCKQGFHAIGDTCLQTAWYSGCPQTEVSMSLRNSIISTPSTDYKPVDMANWIWDIRGDKSGYVTFVDTIPLTSKVLSRMERAELIVTSDNWNRIVFNGNSLTSKAGDYNLPPITYSLTDKLLIPTANQLYANNELKIQVYNDANTKGILGYTFRIVQKCQTGAEDVRGTCQCKWNFSPVGDTCVQRAWVSDLSTRIGSDKHEPKFVTPVSSWAVIPNAKWIWDGDINKGGTFDFYNIMQLPTAMKQNLASVTLAISVDDYFRLVVNNNEITPKEGYSNMSVKNYDITGKITFADSAEDKNSVLMSVTNNAGTSGGLVYKLVVHQTCGTGEQDVDGVCLCLSGWVRLDGVCTQLEWVSSKNSMIGEGANLKPATVITQYSYRLAGTDALWNTVEMNPGSFTFWEKFVLSDRFERDVVSARLEVTSDEFYRVVLNDQVIVDKETCNSCTAKAYEVAAYLIYSDKANTQQNILEITATSSDKSSYVNYKLSIKLARN